MRFSRRNILQTGCMAFLICLGTGWAFAAGETVNFQGHVNGPVEGFTGIDLDTFRAKPGKEKYYTELWFHEMQFEKEGLIVIVNVQLHNLGFSKGYCDAYISVSGPDGVVHLDKDSFKPGEVRIDPEGFGFSFGPNRMELQGDRYQLRYRGEAIQGDLTYRILCPSYQQGDGIVRFSKKGQFVYYTFPIPWAEVTGTLTWEGKTFRVKGKGSMNHDRQVLSPSKFMNQWRVGWFYGSDATVSFIRCTSPDLEGRWVERLVVAEPGRILFSSHDYKYEELDPEPVPGSPVPCPRRFRVEAVHGDDRLSGSYRLIRLQEKKNILSDYPFLFCQLAKLITSETWSYRFWVDFDFELRMDGSTRRIRGTGTANVIEPVLAKD